MPCTTSTTHPFTDREEAVMAINPDTGSEVEIEDDGDFTVTFSMQLPTQPTDDD